jgi:hypothetical protein
LRIYATNSDKSATNGQRYGRLTDLVTLVAERKDQYGSRYIGLSAEFDGESKGASQRLATVPATDGRTEARFDIVLR